MKKQKRLDLIAMIVKENEIHSKAEIVDYLNTHFGVQYSVATISRDLKELKIYKMPVSHERQCYQQYSGPERQAAKAQLLKYYKTEIADIIIKDQYLIIKTSPGFAQSVNYYIDQLALPEIIGTVGGNDTVLIIVRAPDLTRFVYYQLFDHTYEGAFEENEPTV